MVTRVAPLARRGFTLVELLIVLTLLALIASIVTPIVASSIQRAKEATLKENLFVMRKAIDDYYADTGKYPGELQELAEKRYLRKIPVDSLTERDDTWVLVREEGESESNGIIDVRSGSEEKSADGQAYKDW